MDTSLRTKPTTPGAQSVLTHARRPALAAKSAAPRHSKAEALRIANRLKRGAAVAAMLGFSAFGVTIGSHLATASTTAATQTTTTTTNTTSSSSSSGGYFSQSPGGSSFGSSNASSSSPVTSTSAS